MAVKDFLELVDCLSVTLKLTTHQEPTIDQLLKFVELYVKVNAKEE